MKPSVINCIAPIKLKNGVTLPHKVMQAPMLGVMNPLYFQAVNNLNLVDYWITPFIGISTGAPSKSYLRKHLKRYTDSNQKLIVQLLGHTPDLMAATVKNLMDIGITAVNINIACPSSRVISSGSGASLIKKPEVILEMIRKIKAVSDEVSLSLKLRYGFKQPEDTLAILPAILEENIDFAIIHFRTADEGYQNVNGRIQRFQKIYNVSSQYNTPIIASGDIFSTSTAIDTLTEGRVDGVSVARGIFNDPYLIRKILNKISGSTFFYPDKDEGKLIFTREICNISKDNPTAFNMPSLLSLMKNIWGESSFYFRHILGLKLDAIYDYFEGL